MKAITEFSGTIIRLAAKAAGEARKSLPTPPAPEAPAPVEATEAPAEATEAPAEATEAPVEATEAAAEATEATEAPAEAAPAEPVGDSDEVKAALEAAIGEATNISGDRLVRLREALEAVGGKTADVRLVRVFPLGEGDLLKGAKKVGEHQYVVDLLPKDMKQSFGAPGKDDRGGRGRKRGGGGRGGPERAEGPLDGGFSMDSLKNDRGGRRGPGGR